MRSEHVQQHTGDPVLWVSTSSPTSIWSVADTLDGAASCAFILTLFWSASVAGSVGRSTSLDLDAALVPGAIVENFQSDLKILMLQQCSATT